jgi:hypothetical protein
VRTFVFWPREEFMVMKSLKATVFIAFLALGDLLGLPELQSNILKC